MKVRRSEWRRDPNRDDPWAFGAPRKGFVERDEEDIVADRERRDEKVVKNV